MSVLVRPKLFPMLFQQANVKLVRKLKNLEFSKLIHARFIASDCILDRIDLYPKVGPLGFACHDDYDLELLQLFRSLSSDDDDSILSEEYYSGLVRSSRFIYGSPVLVRQCHGYLLKSGLLLNQYVKASLVRLYTMLSDVVGAMELLYNPPELDTRRYNLILVGLIEKGYLNEALIILRRFMLAEDMVWNKETYIVVFGLCARLEDLNLGRQVHNKLLKSDVVKSDDESVCNALIKTYGKCKEISSARKVFDMCEPFNDVDIWNTILDAYLRHGSFEEALNLFYDMQGEDVGPDESTFCILLTTSAELFSQRCGNSLHGLVLKTGFKDDKEVGNTLIDMYSRAGDIKAAENVFLGMTDYRDIVTWNAMICGYSLHSYGDKALDLFQEMLELGEDDPDDETFVGVLNACGHLGHVEEGLHYLYEVMKQNGVEPGLEHYVCIINMLIKAGELDEALSFILSTPSISDVFAWTTFLRGCHDHGNYDLGIQAAELIPDDVATKVSKWFGVTQVSEVMEVMDIIEERGRCWMEMKDKTYEMSSLQKGYHPKFGDLCTEMKVFLSGVHSFTSRKDTEIEDVLRGDRKGYHSEEVAVSHAIMEGHAMAPINIIKSSGVICDNCHTLMKLTSKVASDRLITVRDEYQFHNFRDGHCSCADYW